jgi:hypothetical protein
MTTASASEFPRFSVGYQLAEEGEESFVDIVADYRPHVAEVYFPWAGMPSGRAALTERRGYVDWSGQARLEAELRALREMGVRLNVLFNANCYGGKAVSEYLQNQVASVMERLQDVCGGADVATTCSPAIARLIKTHFPATRTRASVNMRIGTVQGMQYVADIFDEFCVQRDYNRDLGRLRQLREWADARGKGLSILVNSGCLAFCSGQTFHDNLVAHEREVDETVNVAGWSPTVCWGLLKDKANWPILLQSTWVRPEDIGHYCGVAGLVKLATRMHQRPRMVIAAYVRGRHHGNLLDLMEPGFSPAIAPAVIDNDRIPADFFERTSRCDRSCDRCGYCAESLAGALVSPE